MKKLLVTILLFTTCFSLFSNDEITSEQLTQRLSIDGLINMMVYNISNIKGYEANILQYSKDEQLANISDNDTAFFLSKLYLDITKESSNVEQMYIFDYIVEDYSESVWAAYGKFIDYENIIDKAQNYEEFTKFSIKSNTYYSFRLKSSKTGDLYDPLFFYVDSNSVIITWDEEILNKILNNSSQLNLWEKPHKNLLNAAIIPDFKLYIEFGYGIIQSVDFDNSFNLIKSLKYTFFKNIKNTVQLSAQFNSEKLEDTIKIEHELNTLRLDIIDKISRINNEEMNKFTNSIEITSENNIINVEVSIPNSIFQILKLNLIYSFTDLLEVFPEIAFDFGETEDWEVIDTLDDDVIEYKENYNYRSDFKEIPSKYNYNSARLESRIEISEIGYLEDKKNLFIKVKLTPMANEELNWQYKYLYFGIKHVDYDYGYIDFPEDFAIDKLPKDKKVGDNGTIEQTIVFPEGFAHSDIGDITTLFTFLEPQVIKKITISKDDLNKTIKLGSGKFTLLELNKSFIYNFTDMKDSLIEVRALNKKGEPLYRSGIGTRIFTFINGLKSSRMNPYIEGNTETIELYYVDKFNHTEIELPYRLAADFSDIREKEDSSRDPFKVVQYTPPSTHEDLPIDDFYESDISNWPMVNAGPFEIYLRGISDLWELDLELYIKSPNEPAYKTSLSGFEFVIDQITTNSGDIIDRPDRETLKEWESENNTFNKTFNWSTSTPFYKNGDSTIIRERLVLGVTSDYGGLKSLQGHIEFNIPEAVTTFDVDKLTVGQIISNDNIELKVMNFNNGMYNLEITKGQKNIVDVRSKTTSRGKYKILNSYLKGNILSVEPLSQHEDYEFTVSSKNQSHRYIFTLTP